MISPKDTPTILGIAHEHDSGVALIKGGALAFAVNEERFNRRKFTTALPRRCLLWLKNEAGLDPSSVGEIAVGGRTHVEHVWEDDSPVTTALYECLAWSRLDHLLFGTRIGSRLISWIVGAFRQRGHLVAIRRLLQEGGLGRVPLTVVPHHEAHAASAYVGSGFSHALVVTLDAQGDGDCSRVYLAKDGVMEWRWRIPFFHSPGNYYEYVTHLFGFKPGREGKVTGLAARGDPSCTLPVFSERIRYDAQRMRFHNAGGFRLVEIRHLRKRLQGIAREDIAAGVQRHLEDLVAAYVSHLIRTFTDGSTDLVLAGGVFANVKLNQCLAELPGVRRLFVFPHMGDGGLAAGAAMALAMRKKIPCQAIRAPYLGPEIHPSDAAAALHEANLPAERPEDLPAAVSERLADGKVVAVCRGRMEYGPRALGNRSILYHTADPTVNDWLNKRLKRSEFMPFAPILRDADLETYFEGALAQSRRACEYMTITLNASDRCRTEAPAIVHVDGTARPQIVTRESNPFIHEVLDAYARRTGRHVLVNTSFNMHEEPIVCTAKDAVQAFLQGGLDVLVLGPFLVDRPL